MAKYSCKKCGDFAHNIDIFKSQQSPAPDAVYVYCEPCHTEAWGGLKFHPAMNELFNEMFEPIWEFKIDNYCKTKYLLD